MLARCLVTFGLIGSCSLLALVGLAPGCSSGSAEAQCVPGVQVTCPCPGGRTGVQVCNPDGTGFAACQSCGTSSGDASTHEDARARDGGSHTRSKDGSADVPDVTRHPVDSTFRDAFTEASDAARHPVDGTPIDGPADVRHRDVAAHRRGRPLHLPDRRHRRGCLHDLAAAHRRHLPGQRGGHVRPRDPHAPGHRLPGGRRVRRLHGQRAPGHDRPVCPPHLCVGRLHPRRRDPLHVPLVVVSATALIRRASGSRSTRNCQGATRSTARWRRSSPTRRTRSSGRARRPATSA